MNAVLFSSARTQTGRDCWSTPQSLFDELHSEFSFDLDACATKWNAKVKRYYSPRINGLSQRWAGTVWMNPPYSQIPKWVRKAWISSLLGATVVGLLPARTDTRWWFDYVLKAKEIRFLKGRIRFGDGRGAAPFPSCVAVWETGYSGEPKVVWVSKYAR